MALSKNTLEHLLDAESALRSAIKVAAVNEKPLVIQQISKVLYDIEKLKKFEDILDMLDNRKPGSSGNFGTFFTD